MISDRDFYLRNAARIAYRRHAEHLKAAQSSPYPLSEMALAKLAHSIGDEIRREMSEPSLCPPPPATGEAG